MSSGCERPKAGGTQVGWPQAEGKGDGMQRIRLRLRIEEVIRMIV
jgi:hypothetical protein